MEIRAIHTHTGQPRLHAASLDSLWANKKESNLQSPPPALPDFIEHSRLGITLIAIFTTFAAIVIPVWSAEMDWAFHMQAVAFKQCSKPLRSGDIAVSALCAIK